MKCSNDALNSAWNGKYHITAAKAAPASQSVVWRMRKRTHFCHGLATAKWHSYLKLYSKLELAHLLRLFSFQDYLFFNDQSLYSEIRRWKIQNDQVLHRHWFGIVCNRYYYCCIYFSIESRCLGKNGAIGKQCYCVWQSTMYSIEINSFSVAVIVL